MGLRGDAGLISRANTSGTALIERADPRIQSRFGHILNGSLREKLEDFDGHQSTLFRPLSRVNINNEYGDGGREVANVSTRDRNMVNKKRMQQQRGPQAKVDSVNVVPVAKFDAPLTQEDSSFLSQVSSFFGETPRGKALPDINGRLLPDRDQNMSIDLGNYATAAPFSPVSQIRSKASRRGGAGVDYRDLESRDQRVEAHESNNDSRYLSQTYYGQAPAYDERTMQEMARSMAEAMVKTVMQEHLDKNRGRKYFKEIKTTREVFKDSPNSRLVEIDGKYYKMDLKPVKIKPSAR